MHIRVDADACPLAVKEILYRAAERKRFADQLDRFLARKAGSPLARG